MPMSGLQMGSSTISLRQTVEKTLNPGVMSTLQVGGALHPHQLPVRKPVRERHEVRVTMWCT